jgi:putative Mn2+ efflux pump MntP
MLWLSAVLIATVSNLDNLGAGVAFGLRETRITAVPNAVIAALTMTATAAAVISGRALSGVLPASLAAALGASIISAIGAWSLLVALVPARFLTKSFQRRSGGLIGGRHLPSLRYAGKQGLALRDALVLGAALSLNNLAAGVGAGISGIPPLATTLLVGALSLVCIGGGSRGGLSIGRRLGGRPASLIAGVILLGVGASIISGIW